MKKASSTSPAIQLELGSLSSKQVFSMNDFLSGQLYLSESTGLCLDVYGSQTAPGTQVIQYPCSANVNQPNQAWVYNSKSMQMVSGLSTTANMYCLDINGLAGVQKLVLNHCSNSAASQKWSWYYKN